MSENSFEKILKYLNSKKIIFNEKAYINFSISQQLNLSLYYLEVENQFLLLLNNSDIFNLDNNQLGLLISSLQSGNALISFLANVSPEEAMYNRSRERLMRLKELSYRMSQSFEWENIHLIQTFSIALPQKNLNRIYADEIIESSRNFIKALGFDSIHENSPVYGSAFLKENYKATSDVIIGYKGIKEVYEKAVNVLNDGFNHKISISESIQLTLATAELIKSLQNTDSASIRFGEAILVKSFFLGQTKIIAKLLSPGFMTILDENPAIEDNPELLMHILTKTPPKYDEQDGGVHV